MIHHPVRYTNIRVDEEVRKLLADWARDGRTSRNKVLRALLGLPPLPETRGRKPGKGRAE